MTRTSATWCCCPGWSTPTCTSTSPAAPSGRASPPPPAAAAAGGVTTIVDMPLNSIPPTVDRRRAGGEAGRRGRPVPRRRRLLGRRRPRQRRRRCPRCTTPGCSASSASSSTPACRSSRRSTRPACAAALGRASTRCSSCTPRTRRRCGRPPASARVRRLPRLPPAGGRGHARSRPADRRRPARPAPRAHPAPVRRRRAAAARARPGADGRAGHRRDLPALPDPRRRARARRRHRSSSAARRSATRPTADALWAGLADGTIDLRRVRPLAVHRPTSSGWTPATSPPRGAASPRCSSACRVVWTAAAPARPRPGRRRALDGAPRPPTWSACAARAASRVGARRRPRRVRPGRDVRRRPGAGCTTATRSRRTPGATLRGVVHADLAARRAGRPATARAAACWPGRTRDRRLHASCPTWPSAALGGWRRRRQRRVLRRRATTCSTRSRPAFDAAHVRAQGKVYDGWETRRRRDARRTTGRSSGSARRAWCAASSSTPPTSPATTRPPPRSTGCACRRLPVARPSWPPRTGRRWCRGRRCTATPRNALRGDRPTGGVTHVRLTIYPDGGVARLRVHGEVVPDPRLLPGVPSTWPRSSTAAASSTAATCSTARPRTCCCPGRAARHGRRLGDRRAAATTATTGCWCAWPRRHDPPRRAGHHPLQGQRPRRGPAAWTLDPSAESAWFDLLPRVDLQPDTRHRFRLDSTTPATHVRLDIYPDGGMARLRLFGETV